MKNVIVAVIIAVFVIIVAILGSFLFSKSQKLDNMIIDKEQRNDYKMTNDVMNNRNQRIDSRKNINNFTKDSKTATINTTNNTMAGKIITGENVDDDCLSKDTAYFPILEFGIELLVDKSVKNDLIYQYKMDKTVSERKSVYISFRSLIEKIGGNKDLGDCSLKNGGAFAISMTSIGDYRYLYPATTNSDVLKMQIGNEVIFFERQDRCSLLNEYENELIEKSLNVMNKNIKCIKSIEN